MKLKINDRIRIRQIDLFNEVRILLRYDAVASTFAFKFFFDPNVIELKELACIGHYHICTIEHNGELLITGNVFSEGFMYSNKKDMVQISGYSLTGFLEDCEIPPSVPLQFESLGLSDIAAAVCKPFGLNVITDPIVADVCQELFDEVDCKRSDNIKSFLSHLAQQKNVVISHDNYGNLKLTRLSPSLKPIFHFDGGIPATSMTMSFNGQGMHSDIWVTEDADLDSDNAGQGYVKNPYVINTVFRPKVVIQKSGTLNNSQQAAQNILAQELKNLELTITTDRWIVNNKIWRPGQLITVLNPNIYLFKKTPWVIESVELKGDQKENIAILKCVPPEVFNGVYPPAYAFQGINLH